MPRIAIAGFQHETNSFSPMPAGMAEFEMADSWPGLLTGDQVVEGTRGMNLPIAGFAAAAEADGATLVPILWCAAEPSGLVTQDAYDTIAARILDGIARAMPLDGVYLDLHGAMIAEHQDDGEGALLARIRDRFGRDLPIAVSLDMHANMTARIVALADEICIFKTYPHLDMADTGARCWHRMGPLLRGLRPARAFRQADYLIPLPAQQTGADPARRLYADLPDLPKTHVEVAVGFTAGDMADCGPSLVAHAATQGEADHLADASLQALLDAETEFDTTMLSPEAAVARAMANTDPRPTILADVQDNAGAGASSDTTGLLKALLRAGAQGALLGLMHDPDLAALAHARGEGAEITGAMGGRSGVAGDTPYQGRFRVERVDEGRCRYTGEMYGGGVATLGPSAVLRVLDGATGVQVVVTSIRNQCLDQAHFTHFGLSPATARIVCVKSTAHYRADFEPIASQVISVAAPGLFPCKLFDIPYRNLRPGLRR